MALAKYAGRKVSWAAKDVIDVATPTTTRTRQAISCAVEFRCHTRTHGSMGDRSLPSDHTLVRLRI